MPITSRWGRNRDHQLVAFLGCGRVRPLRFRGLWDHAAQFGDGAVEVRPLLLRVIRRRSLRCGMGNGIDSTLKGRFPVLSCERGNGRFVAARRLAVRPTDFGIAKAIP